MVSPLASIVMSVGSAWAAGGIVGLERSYHGRAAGFRTHALVALSAAAVMIITRQPQLIPGAFAAGVSRLDPTHIAQGVMTGVGFLGAGVIFKEGVSVQGLTTAACIWATAAIGVLFGLELYPAGAITAAAVLSSLIVFRWIEHSLPGHVYAQAVLRFRADAAPDEDGLRMLLGAHQVSYQDMSYRLAEGGVIYEFNGTLRTQRRRAFPDLAQRLRSAPGLVEYELSRISK